MPERSGGQAVLGGDGAAAALKDCVNNLVTLLTHAEVVHIKHGCQ